jgi:hypothetical protein
VSTVPSPDRPVNPAANGQPPVGTVEACWLRELDAECQGLALIGVQTQRGADATTYHVALVLGYVETPDDGEQLGLVGVRFTRQGGTQSWDVTVDRDGEPACDCPGFTYRGRCKHTHAARQLLQAAGYA